MDAKAQVDFQARQNLQKRREDDADIGGNKLADFKSEK